MNEHTTTKPTRTRQHRHTKVAVIAGASLLVAALFLVLGMAMGGGGGGYASANGMNMAGMAMPKTTGAQPGTPVATTNVGIKNFAFGPTTITVHTGATVVWTNNDSIDHDVTFNGGAIASSTLEHNNTFAHTFTTSGTYTYFCSIHPFMHGTVIVTG